MIFQKKKNHKSPSVFPNVLATPTKSEVMTWYKKELHRRDKQIQELELKNAILIKTSLRKAKQIGILEKEIIKLRNQNL